MLKKITWTNLHLISITLVAVYVIKYWFKDIMDDYKFLFKVVLVGNAGVGKTCLVRRFTQGLFPPGQGATIGVDFMIKTVEVGNEKIKVSNSCIFWKSVITYIFFF